MIVMEDLGLCSMVGLWISLVILDEDKGTVVVVEG